MIDRIDYFQDGDPAVCRRLNQMVDVLNALLQVRGDDHIDIRLVPGSGMTVNFKGYFTPPAYLQDLTFFPVLLQQTGGGQATEVGGVSYPATWRYRVLDLNNNVLALDVPLYTPRMFSTECTPAGVYPATIEPELLGSGWAVTAPELYCSSPGTTPDGSQPTTLRLWSAAEIFEVDQDCILFPAGNGSGGYMS